MSNLKLPSLKFSDLIEKDYPEFKVIPLAYATTIIRDGDTFHLLHHGTEVAIIQKDAVRITTAGWNSMTTLARLDKVAYDNGLPVRFSRRNWLASMLDASTLKVVRTMSELGDGIRLYRSPIAPGGWARVADNGADAF